MQVNPGLKGPHSAEGRLSLTSNEASLRHNNILKKLKIFNLQCVIDIYLEAVTRSCCASSLSGGELGYAAVLVMGGRSPQQLA